MTAPSTDPGAAAAPITLNVTECTACGENHENLEATRINDDDRQALKLRAELTHRAVCPKTGQPLYGAVPVPVRVTFPMFDVWGWRRQGPRIRSANDKSMSPALIQDVVAVSEYARKVASIAAIEVMNIGQGAMTELVERRLAETVQQLTPVIDLAISRAITGYDEWRKAEDRKRAAEIRDRVWWRRLLRAIRDAVGSLWGAGSVGDRAPQPPAEAR